MRSKVVSSLGQGPLPLANANERRYANTLIIKANGKANRGSRNGPRRVALAPFRPGGGQPAHNVSYATASEIIANVLNEEQKRARPASLLQLLDRQGWGVRADITRRFSTRFASVTLEASWDDDPTGNGRVESRRMALLAVYQEWLVARSVLLGRVVDCVERLRPGYLPQELAERVRTARSSGGLLTPETESLDGPALLRLAAVVVPPSQLEAQLEEVLAETRREVLARPAYRGRPDLVPSLDRGLLLLRSSVRRTIALNAFRAAHRQEVLVLEAELRKQQRQRLERREAPGSSTGLMNMWFREPKAGAAAPSGSTPLTGEAAANSATTRLYGGQLASESPPWMTRADRAEAAAPAGRCGPRGLPAGRCGCAAFRELPGAALYGDPSHLGGSSFGGSDRLQFTGLDAAMTDLLAKADYEVPAGVLSTFARLHRTALLDELAAWQWRQVEAVGGPELARFYQSRCSHAAAIRPAGPLLVGRRTKLDVAPGPELDSLRALARRRGSEVLAVVHPLARKQATARGEWEYWREAYRLWDRFAPMPTRCRTATVTLVLTSEQVPYVGLLEAEAEARGAAARLAAAAAATAEDDIDISSLTSMSSLDFDDAPLPAGVVAAAAAAAAAAGTGASGGAAVTNSALGNATTASGASGTGGSTTAAVETESTVEIFIPPAELHRFLLAMLELLPAHVGDAAAAAMAAAVAKGPSAAAPPPPSQRGGRVTTAAAAAAAASAATVGEWLPASATAVQIRYSPAPLPPPAAAARSAATAAAGTAAGAATATAAAARLPEELEASCYEIRWAQGTASVITAPTGPAASAAYSRINVPPGAPRGGASGGGGPPLSVGGTALQGHSTAVRWCAPMRLTQAQLMSLVNIFTDLAQQLSDQFGIQPPRLVVRTLSPLERLVSAAQGAAGSVVRAVGLLALLAVPLAAAIKAGGGDLDATLMAATRGGGRLASRLVPAAAALAPPRAVRTAEVVHGDGSALGGTERGAAQAAAQAAPTAVSRTLGMAELAAVCQEVEAGLEGRMWLEVTGTAAAVTAAAGVSGRQELSPYGSQPYGRAFQEWPEFQVVVERCQGGGASDVRVLGCRPVNAAGRTVYGELPLAAALRGSSSEAAVKSYLEGLTPERIANGKATPGRFNMPYSTVKHQRLPDASLTTPTVPVLEPAVAVQASPASAPSAATQHTESLQTAALEPAAQSSSSPAEVSASLPPAVADAGGLSPSLSPDMRELQQQPSVPSTSSVAVPPNAALQEPSADEAAADARAEAPMGAVSQSATTEAATAAAAPTVAATSSPSSSSAAVVVFKLELRPASEPSRHVTHGRGDNQREFAQVDVVVRPWYDSDSLLSWFQNGVQLPTLGEEIRSGLLEEEERQRAGFLEEYERLTGRRTTIDDMSYVENIVLDDDVTQVAAEEDGREDDGRPSVSAHEAAREGHGGILGPGASAEGNAADIKIGNSVGTGVRREAGAAAGPSVLQPQQLSEQQLQEALQQLFTSLGVTAGSRMRVTGAGAPGGSGSTATSGNNTGTSSSSK